MSFRNWLEVIDIDNYQSVELQPINNNLYRGLEYIFQVHGEKFVLKMVKRTEFFYGILISDIYSISFAGAEGFDLTNKYGAGSLRIYSQIVAGIKKLMETENVNALKWIAYDPKMELIYSRLFDKFLSKNFTRVSEELIFRNDVLANLMSSIDDDMREKISAGIEQSKSNYINQLNYVKLPTSLSRWSV